jgi:hypothetical protein
MRASATPLANERGLAMAICIFVVAMLLALTAAAQRMSVSDVYMSRNYRSAAQGLYAADAGIMHAIGLINQVGVINLQNDFINVWSGGLAPFGTSAMTQQASYNYNVTLAADPYQAGWPNNTNRGVLTSRASGSDNAARRVDARIVKSDIPNAPPGAIYLATDNTSDATFQGNNFSVNGGDMNFSDGAAGPKLPVPVTTRTEANAQETRDSLNNSQKDNVQGYGFIDGSPATPSVMAGNGPTTAQIDQMITDLLALPHDTRAGSNFNGSDAPFGSVEAPAITYLPGSGSGVTFGNGNMTGAGILIVENSLTINGNMDFKGLIIVRGTTQVTDVTGSATIWGSLWTTDFNLTVGGHADVQFSSEALALANQSGGGTGALPAPVKITAWRDVF